MRKIITTTFVTLDGIMQAPGGPEEDPAGGFKWGGWSVNYWDDVMVKTMDEFIGRPFALLLGKRTYDIFAAHWPYMEHDPNTLEAMAANQLNNAVKYVVSHKPEKLEWQNSILITGDAVEEIKKLKAEDGPEIQVHGSGNLIQTLLKHNLIDEMVIWTFPVVIGQGKRLFGDGTFPSGLKLKDSKVSTTGVIIATYEPAGDIPLGTVEVAPPSEAELARRKKLKEEELKN